MKERRKGGHKIFAYSAWRLGILKDWRQRDWRDAFAYDGRVILCASIHAAQISGASYLEIKSVSYIPLRERRGEEP
jgi:hypothetical protein